MWGVLSHTENSKLFLVSINLRTFGSTNQSKQAGWCSWLSRVLNTDKVLSSILSLVKKIFAILHCIYAPFFSLRVGVGSFSSPTFWRFVWRILSFALVHEMLPQSQYEVQMSSSLFYVKDFHWSRDFADERWRWFLYLCHIFKGMLANILQAIKYRGKVSHVWVSLVFILAQVWY